MTAPSTSAATPQYSALPSSPVGDTPAAPARAWSPAQRIGFRFIFAYLVLYIPSQLTEFLNPLLRPYEALWEKCIPWVGAHVLHLATPITVFPNGSGDTTFNYVQLFCFLVIALIATVVWSIMDRWRTNYARLYHMLRIGLRYALAFWMLMYGSAKLIKTQFPFPGLDRLLESYGQSSPMGLLWTMMGYSVAYNLFAGFAEALGGVLLFWRRTTTFGALIVMAAMSNVVMLNLSYDVPVKLFSMHLFLMALFLAAPQWRRLRDALVLGRAVSAEPVVLHAGGRVRQRWRLAFKSVIIVVAVGFPLSISWRGLRQYGDRRAKPPLYGIWEVARFTRNHEIVPPLVTDSTRWRYVVADYPGQISVHFMNDTERGFKAKVDTTARRIVLTPYADSTKRLTFVYAAPDTSHLELTSPAGTDTLRIALQRVPASHFVLVSRGFHWINEFPFGQ